MNPSTIHRCALACGLAAALALPQIAQAQFPYSAFPKEPLPMIQRSVLQEPDGRMGEMAFDPKTRNMYFASPGSGMVIVSDPQVMNSLQVIRDLNEPQGVAIAGDSRKLIVTCSDGVKIYKIEDAKPAGPDGKPVPAGLLTFEKSMSFAGDSDPIRYDAQRKKAYFGHGKYLDWVAPADGSKADKGLEMPGPVKAIYLEQNGPRVFVSVPSKGQIAVVDRTAWDGGAGADPTKKSAAALKEDATRMEKEAAELRDRAAKLDKEAADLRAQAAKPEAAAGGEAKGPSVETWQLKDAQPYALTADEKGGKLFVASRNPSKLLVLDLFSGKESERLDIGDDAQDAWWDPAGQRVYISTGGNEGRINMVWLNNGKFLSEHRIKTAPGCRTSLLVNEPGDRKYLAVAPKLGGMPTFVYIYVLPTANEHHEPVPDHD